MIMYAYTELINGINLSEQQLEDYIPLLKTLSKKQKIKDIIINKTRCNHYIFYKPEEASICLYPRFLDIKGNLKMEITWEMAYYPLIKNDVVFKNFTSPIIDNNVDCPVAIEIYSDTTLLIVYHFEYDELERKLGRRTRNYRDRKRSLELLKEGGETHEK